MQDGILAWMLKLRSDAVGQIAAFGKLLFFVKQAECSLLPA